MKVGIEMVENSNTEGCGRAEDLVSWLYDECTDDERHAFQTHLSSCARCQEEVASLRGVRHSVFAWKQESLGAIVNNPALNTQPVLRKPSAIAAIREFFNLSPVWMKGAVAFASVAFCVLVVLAVSHLREQPAPVQVQVQTPSKEQLQQEVERRAAELVAQKLERQKATSLQSERIPRGAEQKPNQVASVRSNKRGPLSKAEREQLAADLRLTTSKDEWEIDLIGN